MKYGFVYIWFDCKHKRYYLGSHWGSIDDGYICSSKWMLNSYKRRPHDFKRRILSLIYTNRKDMFEREYEWLSLIKEEEIRNRYYNLQIHAGHWSANENKSTRQKISEKSKDRISYYDPITLKHHMIKPGDNIPSNLIKGKSPEYKMLIKERKVGQKFSKEGHESILNNLSKANEKLKDLYKTSDFLSKRGKKISEGKMKSIVIDGIYYKSRTEAKKILGKSKYYKASKGI